LYARARARDARRPPSEVRRPPSEVETSSAVHFALRQQHSPTGELLLVDRRCEALGHVHLSYCGKKHRAQVNVPDVRSRVAAIELLLREGLGRPAQAEEPQHAVVAPTATAVKEMSWEDLQVVFALQFADDIATVGTGAAGAVIQERLSGVGDAGRSLLRDALDAFDVPAPC
jgi:hypothetical protein